MENLPHYLSIVVILILTGCGLPVPEEFPIIAAGVASSGANATLNPWIALGACLIGALMGDSVLYAIGYHFGRNLVKAHPRLARLLHAEREAKMEQLINRHGLKVLFLARFMVGVRAPVYLSLGILRTPFRKFLLFDAFCATAVVCFFFGLSYLFGENVKIWIRDSEKVFTGIVIGVVLIGLLIFWIRRRRHRAAAGENVDAARPANHATVDVPSKNGRVGAPGSTPATAEEATAQHSRED